MTTPVLSVALLVRFALELALVVAVGVWAWNAASGWLRIVGVIAAPVVVIAIWMLFLSPGAVIALPLAARLANEAVLFLGAAAGLAAASFLPAGILLAALWAIDKSVLLILGSD